MLKSKESPLSSNWTVGKRQGAFYTGGDIALFAAGNLAACMCSDRVAIVDLNTGLVQKMLPPEVAGLDSESIAAFAASPASHTLFTCSKNSMLRIWDVESGVCTKEWKGPRMPVSVADYEQTGTLVATGTTDKAVMVWDATHGHATHSFRGHSGLITALKFMPSAHSVERLVSGSEDGEIRCWDLVSQTCAAVLKDHYSAVTSLCFSPDPRGILMVSGARDRILCVWDTRDFEVGEKGPHASKLNIPAHESVEGLVTLPATALSPASEASAVVGSRSCVVASVGDGGNLRRWVVRVHGEGRAARKYEFACEGSTSVCALRGGSGTPPPPGTEAPVSQQFCALMVRMVPGVAVPPPTATTATATATSSKRKRDGGAVAESTPTPKHTTVPQLVAVTRDQVLTLVDAGSLTTTKTLVGYNDEILDIKYFPRVMVGEGGQTDELVAIATNSEQVRITNLATFDTRLLDGHSDTVLSVSVSPDGCLLASASKDKTLRVWDVATGLCLLDCEGHTEAVTSVAWPTRLASFVRATPGGEGTTGSGQSGSNAWLISSSKDRTLKSWNLHTLLASLPSPRPATWSPADVAALTKVKPRSSAAVVAHEKDINFVAVAPNDRLVATASQDKSIKLWLTADLSAVATLHGHKRGVWAVAFSPVDQVLASASGDRTVRLWSVSPSAGYTCLRTFEGHDASVLNVKFLRKGLQLLSSGADGLVKLWSVKDAECVNTFDAHTQKIWALAVRAADPTSSSTPTAADGSSSSSELEGQFVTGGGDSIVNVWRDVTGVEAEGAVAAAEASLLKQQSLYSAMASRDYRKAISLTLELDQPGRCGDIMQELLEVGPTPSTATMSAEALEAKLQSDMLLELADLQVEAEGQSEHSVLDEASVSVALRAARALGHERAARPGAEVGHAKLVGIVTGMSLMHLGRLLAYIREWNTQSRHGLLAQALLTIILKHVRRPALLSALQEARLQASLTTMMPGLGAVALVSKRGALSGDLAPVAHDVEVSAPISAAEASTAAVAEFKKLVEAVIPYSERHLERLDRLQVSSYLVDYTLASMDVLLPTEDSLAALGINSDGTVMRPHKVSKLEASYRGYDDSSEDDE